MKLLKLFTITKTGYSSGVYGCSAEYFTCIFTHREGLRSFRFYGMYGAEERIEQALKDLGFEYFYCPSEYGKVPRNEGTKYAHTEYTVLENLKEIIEKGYLATK